MMYASYAALKELSEQISDERWALLVVLKVFLAQQPPEDRAAFRSLLVQVLETEVRKTSKRSKGRAQRAMTSTLKALGLED